MCSQLRILQVSFPLLNIVGTVAAVTSVAGDVHGVVHDGIDVVHGGQVDTDAVGTVDAIQP